MNRALRGVILFSVIEVITLVAWLVFAGVPLSAAKNNFLAIGVLTAGLFLEHFVSINVGAGRPPFGSLPPDEPHGD